MKRKTIKIIMKILLWILKHIVVQSKNLNKNNDKYRENDDSRPVTGISIGIKGTF